MLYVLLDDGTIEELPDVVTTDAVDGTLACMNADGTVVKSYHRFAVLAFSHAEAIKTLAEKFREGKLSSF
jgi:hypothetical protein